MFQNVWYDNIMFNYQFYFYKTATINNKSKCHQIEFLDVFLFTENSGSVALATAIAILVSGIYLFLSLQSNHFCLRKCISYVSIDYPLKKLFSAHTSTHLSLFFPFYNFLFTDTSIYLF